MVSFNLENLYNMLLSYHGNQKWWPAETAFEVVVGSILTQNTNWNNVEKAINNLKTIDLLEPEKILSLPSDCLKKFILPAGFYNQKTERLKIISSFIIKELKGNIKNLKKYAPQIARKKLLNLKGIGFETADSILLYAADIPVFVIDSYTKRLVRRLYTLETTDYHALQNIFMNNLAKSVNIYKEYHALIVEHSKILCRNKPLCHKCFIKNFCSYFLLI